MWRCDAACITLWKISNTLHIASHYFFTSYFKQIHYEGTYIITALTVCILFLSNRYTIVSHNIFYILFHSNTLWHHIKIYCFSLKYTHCSITLWRRYDFCLNKTSSEMKIDKSSWQILGFYLWAQTLEIKALWDDWMHFCKCTVRPRNQLTPVS
jgi:hypothetical protein